MKCHRTATSTGKPCGNHAITGATVCRMHGGAARQVRAAAARRIAEQKAHDALGRLEHQPCDDPLEALANLAGECVAWKQLLAERVAALRTIGYTGPIGEQIRADIQVFERALDRCAHVLGMIAKLDIDNRIARVREHQVALVEKAIQATLEDVGLDDTQRQKAYGRLAHHLRAVA